ncbi:MAG: sensor histidine kinase, partial [Propioniciclava sp.]
RASQTITHPLGPLAELAAYRISQESLTNVLKHAGESASVWVVLHHREEGLSVTIGDDGVGAPEGDGSGHGLIGLHERAAALGGQVVTHADPVEGFTVSTFIPAPAGGAE